MANPSAPSSATKPKNATRPRILLGEVNLTALYHKGAVLKNSKGDHVLVLDAWGRREGTKHGFGAKVVRCSPEGVEQKDAKEGILSDAPSTFLFRKRLSGPKPSLWEQEVTLVKSEEKHLPAGITSLDPGLILVPYGPHFGKAIGQLSDNERQVLAKLAKNPNFKRAAETAKAFPGVNEQATSHRLSEVGMRTLLRQQGELIRALPLVTVIEQYCGYAPEEIAGKLRKYRVGSEILNLNTARNSFGSLNDFKFRSLKKDRGSSNNAMDLVAAVREMEGAAADFKTIREGLIRHFNLQAQLDRMYEDARAREQQARKEGKAVEYAPTPTARVDASMKDAAGKKSQEEEEIPFDLLTGMQLGSTEVDRGGGFAEREDLWPAARRFLVEERKLAPELVDYLYANRNLYAARREFPANPRFPYRSNHQDVIVAPVIGFKTGEIVGVDTKPLPRKHGEKTEGRNHGRTGQGAFMFGHWGPGMKRAVLTEGFIKGIAFLQLYRNQLGLGPDDCILSRSGAKPTLEIIPMLKKWGASAIVAYDNDYTGRSKSKAFFEECEKQGVPCERMFVEPSELTVSISGKPQEGYHDETRAKTIETDLVRFVEGKGLKWARDTERQTPDAVAIRVPNTEDVTYFIEELLKEDRKLSNKEYNARAKGLSEAQQMKLEKKRWMKVEVHHKDWDDIVKKGPYQPKIPAMLAALAIATTAPAAPVAKESGVSEAATVMREQISRAEAVSLLTHIASIASEMKERIEKGGLHVSEDVRQKIDRAASAAPASEPVAAAPVPTPRGDTSGAPNTTPAPVKAILVSRLNKGKPGVTYSIGTAETLYDLPLTPEQEAKAGALLTEDLPREAEVSGGDKPRLLGISSVDGQMVPSNYAFGQEVVLAPAPEPVQRAWKNPRSQTIIDAISQLRASGGLPTPSPAPVHEPAAEARK